MHETGQIGAIRLGMSRALQNWAPDQFRPPLKEGKHSFYLPFILLHMLETQSY